MKKLIAFCFVLLSFVAFAQTSNEENLKDWVFPKNIKEKKFELKSFEFGKTTNYEMNFSEISEKTFKIDNRKYEVDNNRILLSEIDLDYDVNTYTENNIYWELPESEKIKTWKYAEINGYFINFKSYWKTIDGIKFLITERITIDKYNRSNNLRKVEYYQ